MQGIAWHMCAPILYLKRHSISVTKPNDTAMFNLVRGVLKWAFLKMCVVNGTHVTKTSTVLNARSLPRRRSQWSGTSRFVELRLRLASQSPKSRIQRITMRCSSAFLEDETMMRNMIEFVGSLELKCSWK